MNHELQGLNRWANTDPSLHYNTLRPKRSGPTWQSVWIYLLRIGDEQSAQLVRDLNATHSDECHFGDHDLCHWPHCECVCHKPVVKLEHAPLMSCREVELENEEREWEAKLASEESEEAA